MNRRLFALGLLLTLASCTTTPRPQSEKDGFAGWSAPPLPRAVSVRDGRTGEVLTFAAFLDAIAKADAVFLGESHTDETTHRVELAVYEGLLARRKGDVVLSMEMFERDVQAHVNAYLAGEIDERTFLDRARPWGNYRTAYRPLIERAKSSKRPVVAANFPTPLRRKIAMKGPEVLESLEEAEARLAPAELFPNTPAYWRRADNAVRSHRVMAGRGGSDDSRLYSTQSLWDNAMGEACATALEEHPGHVVLHVNGGFHTAYWDGTVHQLLRRRPQTKVVTVSISPTLNPNVAELSGTPVADYVVFAESRATDVSGGTWSVTVGRKQAYRFHLPEGSTDEDRVPLLIWLPDDGVGASDGMDLWKDRLGVDGAIAVLDAPFRAIQEDLSKGGRWFWPDTFSSDVGSLIVSVERIWGYLLRNYPIDPGHVCVAGEGTGATVVASIGLLTDRMDIEAVAIEPGRYAKIRDFSLPLPEFQGDEPAPDRSLRVVIRDGDVKWWSEELGAYAAIGLDASILEASDDPWTMERDAENLLRAAMGLEARPAIDTKERRYILTENDSPRARQWVRLRALRTAARDSVPVAVLDAPPESDGAIRIPTEIRAEAFAAEGALPPCPGPFGGTTVLVLPDDLRSQEVRAWEALMEDDPLAKRSRFLRMRIATATGEGSLPVVLETLRSEGRENILIVPALFCADGAWMRTLKRSVVALEDQMTLQWLPGLGGRDVPTASTSEASAQTPVRHSLSVMLTPETHRLAVEDTIELPLALSKAGSEFTLDADLVVSDSEPSITRSSTDNDAVARYTLDADATEGELRISYSGTIDHGLSDQKEEYTRGFRESRGILGREGVYLHGKSEWIPKFNEQLIRFDLDVQAPADWHVISQGNGTSRGEDGLARWGSGGLLEQVYLVGGPLVVDKDAAGAVETLVYLHDRDDALSRKYLDATARYIEMYRKLIGPYPYDKFALVENFWETGYGMPSFTLLGPKVVRFPFILHSSYPHEILHNWWGNSVFVDYETGNWCEGLTAYLADHLIQEQRGKGTEYRRSALQKYRNYVKEGRDFPLSEFRSRHSAATEAVGYGKSLMTFHMLRRDIGDDAFRGGLAKFYRKNRGKHASFDDIRTVFESVVDKDLSPFFSQWIDRAGAPALSLNDVSFDVSADGFTITGTLGQTQQAEPFALNVPIHVQTDQGLETFVVHTAVSTHRFELAVKSRPLSLGVDPMFDIFRQLDPRETPPSIGQLFGEPRVLAVLPGPAGAEGGVSRYRELMESWQTEDHEIEFAFETELESLPPDRAVWILGKDNRFASDLIASTTGVSSGDSGAAIDLAGEHVPLTEHSTVVVFRHPENLEKAIGWITVDPAGALAGMSRKLPHYGKYSYLAFEGDEPTNIVKGQWSANNSPLVIHLAGDQGERITGAVEERKALAELPPVFSRKTLMDHVAWLASPERAGRGLGTKEIREAAEYISRSMESAGLVPGGDDGTWFQRFTVADGPDGAPVEAVNVIGVLPGSRAEWGEQSLILSAHYDHLGLGWPDAHEGNQDKIHPGADDNASGVAVMLELARNLASEGGGSRNLVVIAFSAEENGRLGSKHYVENPRFPLQDVRGVINLDTVGRLFAGRIAIHGTGTADEWQHVFRGCGFVTGIPSQNVPASAEGSDQASFIERGIPGVQIFTGAHEDYHRPSDTPDKIDGVGLVKVATFLKEAVTFMLEREAPLTVRIEGASNQPQTSPHGGGRKILFGTVPDFAFQGEGVRIASTVQDSPAARAGLVEGDILVRLDETDLADLRSFSEFLRTLEPDQEVEATVVRDGKKVSMKVVVKER